MIFNPLALTGAFEILLEPHTDQRGFFARFFCEEEFAQHGLNTQWAQMNLSFTRAKGSVRGLHFQRGPAAEIKLVRCLRGRVHDVIVDLRQGSPGFGQAIGMDLSAERRNAIYVPQGFAHGFQTLEDDAELQYFHSRPYSPGHEGGINVRDRDLAINWPLPLGQMSERDQTLPVLAETLPL